MKIPVVVITRFTQKRDKKEKKKMFGLMVEWKKEKGSIVTAFWRGAKGRLGRTCEMKDHSVCIFFNET